MQIYSCTPGLGSWFSTKVQIQDTMGDSETGGAGGHSRRSFKQSNKCYEREEVVVQPDQDKTVITSTYNLNQYSLSNSGIPQYPNPSYYDIAHWLLFHYEIKKIILAEYAPMQSFCISFNTIILHWLTVT